jgi:hypothetical protein
MKIINIVETEGGKILQIIPFPVYEEQLSEDVVEEAELTYIQLINEHIYPVVLSDESQEHWLNERIYHNGDYRLEIITSHTN